jgi:hypothetical protein
MLKILEKKQLITSCVALVLLANPVEAREIVEINRKFVWTAVPETLYSPELENTESDLDLHYINTNNIIRRRNLVIFEVVTPDAAYLRIEGNCQTEKIHELSLGSFESENKLTYTNTDYPWRKVNELEGKLLKFACNIK